MTTVAYTKGIMACDSCYTTGVVVDTLNNKIHRTKAGALIGQAGTNDVRHLLKFLDDVKTPKQMPMPDELFAIRADFIGLMVFPNGSIWKLHTTMVSPENWDQHFVESEEDIGAWEITEPYAAVGSGWELAKMAMMCGKSAFEAVQMASRMDNGTRPPFHKVALKVETVSGGRKGKVGSRR